MTQTISTMIRIQARWLLLVLILPVCADFVAYNDQVAGPGTHPHTTLYAPNATASGLLRDGTTGAMTSVTLSTSQVGAAYANSGAEPSPGTDAATIFSGRADFRSGTGRNSEVSGSDWLQHAFTNLDPESIYEFVGTSTRGYAGYSNRWTLVTLNGADSFRPLHSDNPGVVTNGLPANQAAYWCGDNSRTGQGVVVRWVDIDPGADGAFSIVSSQYTGAVPTSICGSGTADGAKGYAITALRLTETFTGTRLPPEIIQTGATNVLGTQAQLSGEVLDTGGLIPQVTLYYGRSDAGQSPAWEHEQELGPQSGTFSSLVTKLLPDTDYHFTVYATNAAGADWAPESASFRTPAVSLPMIRNAPASDVGGTSAIVHGRVDDAGNDASVVTVYYGTTDGGSNEGLWDASVTIGPQAGDFGAYLGALQSETSYFFRSKAENAAGTSWAPSSLDFSTTAAPLLSIVINEVHFDPVDKTSPSEFIELFNNGTGTVDLAGWQFTDGIAYTFPPTASLPPGGYWVIAQDASELQQLYGVTANGSWQTQDRLANDGETMTLRNAAGVRVDEVTYAAGFPWPTRSRGLGASMELIHPDIENDLGGAWRCSTGLPTPGAQNSVFSTNIPPRMRQVNHGQDVQATNVPVIVTMKITDPDTVTNATLLVQVVEPGDYLRRSDPRYASEWSALNMRDDGTDGDAVAGDSIYSVQLDASLQQHRRLIRYKVSATDALGNTVVCPYPDDTQPNFAYFVYDQVPDWTASARPGVAGPVVYPGAMLSSIPVSHLITRRRDHCDAQYVPYRYGQADQILPEAGTYRGSDYPWEGALVYDGTVYDHIRYRARGGGWRYAMGKNMWKFDFNPTHDLEARDDYGKAYDTTWRKLNFSAVIQQGNFEQRGEQGLFEAAGFRLHNLAGNAAPNTHFMHFRIIEDADEGGPDQFSTDFQGLYLAIEQPDGRLLDEHKLPDGNLYKMESGTGTLNNQGPTQPSDRSDLDLFMNTYKSNPPPSPAWWAANLDFDTYYSFRAIAMAIHDYDISANKNYFYYHNPEDDKWSVLNWDLDLCWTTTYYPNGGTGPLSPYVLDAADYPEHLRDYNNRLREVVDLLFNPEQVGMLLDELIQFVHRPGQPSFVDADRAMWDYNPILTSPYVNSTKAGHGRFYESSPTGDFAGMRTHMLNYVTNRVSRYLAGEALVLDPRVVSDEGQQPHTPTLSYTGAPGYPINALTFSCSPFSSDGSDFAALQWRIAETTDLDAPSFDPAVKRRYEIEAQWESGDITNAVLSISIPGSAIRVGRHYRVRVRMKGNDGRYSHWSDPYEFVSSEPDTAAALVQHLRITELMYDPIPDGSHEFIELKNADLNETLDLSGIKLTDGVSYTFPEGSTLAPGEFLLVTGASPTNDFSAFRSAYGLSSSNKIIGPYSGKLSNAGETLTLKTASSGTVMFSFTYGDGRGWPLAADGAGHSLVPLTSVGLRQASGGLDYPGNWRHSGYQGGSPGRADPLPPTGLVINELVAHTDIDDPVYDSNDRIELRNRSSSTVPLTDWYLSDDKDLLDKWPFPGGSMEGGSLRSLDEIHDFHNPITSGFGLNKDGEMLLLSYLPGTPDNRVVDALRFDGQENGVSLGRVPDGSNYWAHAVSTPGADNLPPIGDVVMSELLYHHPLTNTLEYLEILNPHYGSISLFNATGPWRVRGGIEYEFPPGVVLEPNALLLLVPFDPEDATDRARFLNTYGPVNATLLGPYRGKLSNISDRITLQRPQAADFPSTSISWVVVDELIYANQHPFTAGAAGSGASIHRISGTLSGNDPANWRAEAPSPGAAQLETEPDQDGDRMADAWEWQYFGSLARNGQQDWDGDRLGDRHEFLAGTVPTDPGSTLQFVELRSGSSSTELSWASESNRMYSIELSPNLTSSWQRILFNIPATPPRNTQTLSPAPPPVFYRVLLE